MDFTNFSHLIFRILDALMDMMSTDEDLFLDVLKRCFPDADNVRIVHNTLEDGNLHFTSNVTRFVVEYEQDHKTCQKQLVMKVPTSAPIGAIFESLEFFNREICMYEKVIPRMRKYLDKSLTPAHLYTTDSKILVLEDLIAKGYESGEKLPPLDFGQTEAVLKAFAHFHAASHKLHEEDPHFLSDLLATHIPVIECRRMVVSVWAPVVLELLNRQNETSLAAKVRPVIDFLEKDDDELRTLIDQSNFKFVVLNHGDSRKDNVLLKYGSHNQVENVQFIDFQISVWSSPLFDIFYFLTTSVSFDVIEAHFDDLIDGYLHELNEKLEKLNCTSTYLRPDFDEDLKIVRFYLFFCVLCLCYVISPLDRNQKEEMFLEPEPNVSYLCHICFKDENFVKSIYRWLKYCEKLQVFDSFPIKCVSALDEIPLCRF